MTLPREYADLRALCEAELGPFEALYVTPHFDQAGANPYLRILYRPFAGENPARLRPLRSMQFLRPWLRRVFRGERAAWHQHWLQFSSLPTFLRANFRLLGTALFAWSGGRVLWTLHNERPHVDRLVALNQAYCRVLARLIHRLHVHNRETVPVARQLFGIPESRVAVLAHPPFPTVPIPRAEALLGLRQRYGLDLEGKRMFLMFGIIAPYKGIDEVLEAFRGLDPARSALVVAGPVRGNETAYGTRLRELARLPGVTLFDRLIPEEDVNLFFCAADWAVFNHRRSLNSSAMQLAWDYGCRILGPDLEAASVYRGERVALFSTPAEMAEKLAILSVQSDRIR